ncbi:TBC1 domain family member 22A [Oryx dammah]|uniref:TBC1 domain family member 22A n=1 Tax=Oryx dammah TaxID=59534 RepID=UPI001A9B9E6D|nr:TBC1 domain family member 22A [Oryx dammah]
MASDGARKQFWKRGSSKVPGSIQHVYGAQHPPFDPLVHGTLFKATPKLPTTPVKAKRVSTFQEFESNTSDAWDAGEDDDELLAMAAESLNTAVVMETAHRVLRNHSQQQGRSRPPGAPEPSAEAPAEPSAESPVAPGGDLRLVKSVSESHASCPEGSASDAAPLQRSQSLPHAATVALGGAPEPSALSSSALSEREASRLDKFKHLLSGPNTDLEELRKLSWSGIPKPVRAITWKLLSGYLPANVDRRPATLQRKQKEYFAFIDHYYDSRNDEVHQDTYRQIHIDIPRMSPEALILQPKVTEVRAGIRTSCRGSPMPAVPAALPTAGASVFIELPPSLHTGAWGLGAGGNAPSTWAPTVQTSKGQQVELSSSTNMDPPGLGVSSAGIQPPRDCPTGGHALERAGGSVLSGSSCPWRRVTAPWWRGSQPGGPFLPILSTYRSSLALGGVFCVCETNREAVTDCSHSDRVASVFCVAHNVPDRTPNCAQGDGRLLARVIADEVDHSPGPGSALDRLKASSGPGALQPQDLWPGLAVWTSTQLLGSAPGPSLAWPSLLSPCALPVVLPGPVRARKVGRRGVLGGWVQRPDGSLSPLPRPADDEEADSADVSRVPEDALRNVEADTYWCMSRLLDGIQDNYTFAQPGIQMKVKMLEELVSRIDEQVHRHLGQHEVRYLQFTFRWMNNLLTRELPLRCTVRLWDTYQSEPEGFANFHLYVCAAFLVRWRKEILEERDFQELLLFLQNLPTARWGDEDVSLLLAEAYRLKFAFADAPNHYKK